MPDTTSQTEAGGKTVKTDGTEEVSVEIVNSESAAVAGGNYLNVPGQYVITQDEIAAMSVAASGEDSDVEYADGTVTFSGDKYVAVAQVVSINEKFSDTVKESDLTKTFWHLTADGSNGLWEVKGLSYTDGSGNKSSLNGNYYRAEGNYGISATFAGDSKWTITNDSYLGSLTIEDHASIEAPSGYTVKMTVDGKETEIKSGTYTGKIVLTLEKN